MKVKLILRNELGEFESNVMEVNMDAYQKLSEGAKSFYSSGFEMYLEDGFMVVAPEMVRKSILMVKIIEK
jgi:hypothetical protein